MAERLDSAVESSKEFLLNFDNVWSGQDLAISLQLSFTKFDIVAEKWQRESRRAWDTYFCFV